MKVLVCALLASVQLYAGVSQFQEESVLRQLDFSPEFSSKSTGKNLVYDYLSSLEASSKLPVGFLDEAKLEVQKSLLGTHYRFQQYKDSVEVEGGELIVSLNQEGTQILKVFQYLYPLSDIGLQGKWQALVGEERALDLAWSHLGVQAAILEANSVELKRLPSVSPSLLYVVEIATSKPRGYWQVYVNANTGEVISQRRREISRRTIEEEVFVKDESLTLNRRDAEAKFWSQSLKQSIQKALRTNGVAVAKVFAPNPVTTLRREDLQDTTDAAAFDSAYVDVELPGVQIEEGVTKLIGPWVQLKDFETPSVAPSERADGVWDARRKDTDFNDVMTYYHIDKNQRYIQSLGFVGSTGIQYNSIEADANGLSGADNSHYIPRSNRIAFGHGCVDDNEDSDVILHEYGHAINFSINKNWQGGDTGAMGEGFGDYWAASYSASQPEGDYKKFWVFKWDGHNSCWAGRVTDALDLRYDHRKSHQAHYPLGEFTTDELWSTPLFQAHVALLDLGVSREEVDSIVLEAQFGLGRGLKMRDMANSIWNVAQQMFPNGPHASVFREKFLHHGILAE